MATEANGDRFAQVTPDNHAGSIWIATLLCLVYTVITILTRGFLRKAMYGIDDYLILGATVLHLGEAVAVIVGLRNGLGQTLTLLRASGVSSSSKATFAAQLLFVASSAFAKSSTIWLMVRLFNLRGPKAQGNAKAKLYFRICTAVVVMVAIWAVGSIVGLSVECSVSNFIRTPPLAQCPDQYLRWQVITGVDVATEVIIVLMSVIIVAPVHLSMYLKFQVVLAFLFRVPLVALAVLRLHYVEEYTRSANAGIAQEPILVIQQAYLFWTIISATIPNLKAFVRSFGSGFGIGVDMERYTQAYGSKGSYGKQYELGSMKNTNHSANSRDLRSYNDVENQETVMALRPGAPQTPAQHQESASIDSMGSQERIIRKDVQWRIHYENNERVR